MKTWLIRCALILFYSLPYVFFSMNGDVVWGTMAFYALMIVAFWLLSFISKKTGNRVLVPIGNLCSFIVSFVFMSVFKTEKWYWYFKPLTHISLMITVSVVALLIQLIFTYKNNK